MYSSRWQNVDNDSADVTSASRSFQVRAATTEKLWKTEDKLSRFNGSFQVYFCPKASKDIPGDCSIL